MKDESGNVLFFILIGVALYAALSFTITRSDTNNNLDAQTVYATANSLIQYGGDVKQGVARVRAQNGCAIEQISFDPAPYDGSYESGYYNNPNSPSDKRCHVFHPDGGNVDYRAAEWQETLSLSGETMFRITGEAALPGIGVSTCSGGICKDIYINVIAPKSSTDELCVQYNRILENDALIPTLSRGGGLGGGYKGSFGTTTQNFSFSEASGLKAYCFNYISDPTLNKFVYVLVER